MDEKLRKLILSAIGLLTSLVLITVSTFAWYAISTAPEVQGIQVSVASVSEFLPFEFSLTGEGDWTSLLDITSMLDGENVLRPISTYDGVDWYLPVYNAIGGVSGFDLIPEDLLGNYVNSEDSDLNYFVYQDVYVRTVSSEADTFDLRLSNPSGTSSMQEETDYGTYVVYRPEKDALSAITDNQYIVTNDAMYAFRVGFQVYDEDDVAEGPFYIYEPNADGRSADFISLLEEMEDDGDTVGVAAEYVYDASLSATVKNYAENYAAGTMYATQTPIESDNTLGFDMVTVGADETESVLIQQKETFWDTDKLAGTATYDSTYIKTIGEFASTPPAMTTISQDEVKRIRIYFWLEGQDVDCWNQILDGNVFANLEFTGAAVESEEESDD